MSSSKIYLRRRIDHPEGISGCMQFGSINYNPNATIDDHSCIAPPPVILGCTNPIATNYSPTATKDDESCTFSNSTVTFNTGASVAVQTLIGANLFEADISKLPAWTTISTALGLQVYYYLLLSGNLPAVTVTKLNTFLASTGAKIGINYPLENNTVLAAFPALLNTINTLSPKPVIVQLAQESISGSGITNAQYVSRSQQAIAYLNGLSINSSWDAGLIYKTNKATLARNAAIAPLTDTIYARQYEQISPDIVTLTTNQTTNFNALNDYFDIILPGFVTSLFTALPHVSREVIEQWQNEDVGTTLLSDPLANWSIGEMARFTLANTSSFAYLIWLTLGNLITNTYTAEREYDSIKRIVPAFKFTNTMPVSVPHTGCKAQGFNTGANSWGLLITNFSSNQYTITQGDISIATKTVSGNFSTDIGHSTSWNGAQVNQVVSANVITIQPYSTSLVTFVTI